MAASSGYNRGCYRFQCPDLLGGKPMNDLELWMKDKREFGWEMPSAPRWKRLPIIRHIRASYHGRQVARHNAFWRSLGKIPTGYDSWVIYGIAKGLERPHE